MGEVIHAKFGSAREWEETRGKLREGMKTIGGLFGDDPALMEAKADAAYQILREIVEDLPGISIRSALPNELTEAGRTHVSEELRKAALAGIELAMTHAVSVMMSGIYDLCTSKLAKR